jgi:pimeloyl-ACP methyl ester carboxylesterase
VTWRSRTVVVDGVRTHYLEAGEGFPLVLLHGGAPGDCAEASWERNIGPLSERFRVLAADWLGFGGTDKLRDFGEPFARPVRHLGRVLQVLDVTEGHFAGLSMGGTLLVRSAAGMLPPLPVRRMVLVSGGGFSPDNEARRALQAYDGSLEAMRRIVSVTLRDQRFAEDEEFVRRRHEWSLVPGAWEHAASMGLRPPGASGPVHFGAADPTPYEQVAVPTLVTAGGDDPLREPGYADELARRIPNAEALVFEDCGHAPNIERPEEWNAAALRFLQG